MSKRIVGLVVAVAFVLTASVSFAGWKGFKGSGGWGPGTKYAAMYNPATVETLSGTVQDIAPVVPFKGMYSGVMVVLKTDKETLNVHLGPAWYVERLDVKIDKGDTIEVKGSKTTFANAPTIIASEIKKADTVIVLRDNNGIPVWAGWRR